MPNHPDDVELDTTEGDLPEGSDFQDHEPGELPPDTDSMEDMPHDNEYDPGDLKEQQDFAQDDQPFSDFGDDF